LGFTEADVATLPGVCRETVSRGWSACARDGRTALPPRPHRATDRYGSYPSGPAGPTNPNAVRGLQPRRPGHSGPAVDPARGAAGESAGVGDRYAGRTVGSYLRRWGYTTKRPRRRAKKQDPEEVRRGLEEAYPALEQRAEKENAEIHWCDETGVGADEYPACGYAPEGEPVTMAVPDPHIRMNPISTITNEGRVRVMTYARTMSAALFRVFLGRLLRSTTGTLFVIVDRLRAHETPEVVTWVAAHRDRIELFY
jgi:hypothetical protein